MNTPTDPTTSPSPSTAAGETPAGNLKRSGLALMLVGIAAGIACHLAGLPLIAAGAIETSGWILLTVGAAWR